MTTATRHRFRAFLALLLFGLGNGGAQLLDAVVFHGGPAHAEVNRVNSGDHCHAEQCDLGAPIVSPPPVDPPLVAGRFAPPTRLALVQVPSDAPRSAAPAGPLGSRAPPRFT